MQIQKAILETDEVVLLTVDGKYSIVKDGIDIKELVQKVPVETVKDNPFLEDLFVIGLFFIMIMALVLYGRKRRESELKKEKEKYNAYSHEGFTQTIIKPTTSKYKFSDIAGINEVKEELQEIVDF